LSVLADDDTRPTRAAVPPNAMMMARIIVMGTANFMLRLFYIDALSGMLIGRRLMLLQDLFGAWKKLDL
jgi:hypothetical protein